MSPRTGRPKSDNPRKSVRSVHFTDDELATLKAAAETVEEPVGKYIRDAALDRAKAKRRRSR